MNASRWVARIRKELKCGIVDFYSLQNSFEITAKRLVKDREFILVKIHLFRDLDDNSDLLLNDFIQDFKEKYPHLFYGEMKDNEVVKKLTDGSHEIAETLNNHSDVEINASIDIPTGVFNKHGDEIIAKLFGHSIVEAICADNGVTFCFETCSSGGVGVDVIEVVKAAQKRLASDMKDSPKGYVRMTEKEFEAISEVVASSESAIGQVNEYLSNETKKGVRAIKSICKRNNYSYK